MSSRVLRRDGAWLREVSPDGMVALKDRVARVRCIGHGERERIWWCRAALASEVSMRRWSSRTELAARLSRPCLAAPLPGCQWPGAAARAAISRLESSCSASRLAAYRRRHSRSVPARASRYAGKLPPNRVPPASRSGRGRRSPSRPRRVATDRASRTPRSPETRAATARADPASCRRGGCSAHRAARCRPGR